MLLGTLLALALVEPKDIQDIHAHMTVFMDQYHHYFPDIPGFDLTRMEAEWSRFRNGIPEIWKFNKDGREFQVGEAMKARGLTATHPVILIPGVISTGLESWSTSPDYRAFFREKLWGGFNMISQVTFNKEKWISAMTLDPITGLDPPDVRIRAAEGIDAASSFVQGYWIWSKIVENLAVVNYDTNNLYLAPYDWRLSYYNLEERDGYFSRLKATIEGFKRRQKRKVVIAAHSMGSTVLLLTNLLYKGVAKAMSAFLSGEMKDTVQMNPAGAYGMPYISHQSCKPTQTSTVTVVLERFFSRQERRDLFRSWAGSASMWIKVNIEKWPRERLINGPKGGNAIWGNDTHAPDDRPNTVHTHGELIAFRQACEVDLAGPNTTLPKLTAEQAGTWILEQTPSSFQVKTLEMTRIIDLLNCGYQKMLATNYSFGLERDETILERNNFDHTKWTNPLEVRLPNAPSMTLYCVYGHGKETERSYWYIRGDQGRDDMTKDNVDQLCRDCADHHEYLNISSAKQMWIDATFTNDTMIPKVKNGIKMGEGDGTVSLLSLGAMCAEGWKRPRWNPGGIKVVTVELPHRPVSFMPRGGANTSDHVDILGSTSLNEIIAKVATGVGHEVTENYVSDIREYARKIEWD
ncbi:hypothetical protein C0992_000089 [Termitomyces sp. T32_za158]|nr:hypothetical protein C0992_000089 [Termitomyces sp. T32_za158]